MIFFFSFCRLNKIKQYQNWSQIKHFPVKLEAKSVKMFGKTWGDEVRAGSRTVTDGISGDGRTGSVCKRHIGEMRAWNLCDVITNQCPPNTFDLNSEKRSATGITFLKTQMGSKCFINYIGKQNHYVNFSE